MIVITGGAKGIGRCLVQEYLGKGYEVLALDADAAALKELSLSTQNALLSTFECDVAREEDWARVRECLSKKNRVKIWINNAGLTRVGPFEEIAPEEFRKVLDVNFWGVVHGTRLALSLMKDPLSGVIINVSSLNGILPAPLMTAYVASKHAVTGFTRALQLEHEQTQNPVRVVLVSPGFVKTDILRASPKYSLPQWMERISETPEKVASEIVRRVEKGEDEIVVTIHGRLLSHVSRLLPRTLPRASKILLAKNWKEFFGLEPIESKKE